MLLDIMIFSFYGEKIVDISFLRGMPYATRVWLDAHLAENHEAMNTECLCEIKGLNALHLGLFDCRDYSFINNLSAELEE